MCAQQQIEMCAQKYCAPKRNAPHCAGDWETWATTILSRGAERREELINSAPPENIIHLLTTAPLEDNLRLENISRANRIAMGENQRVREQVDELVRCLGHVKSHLEFVKKQVDSMAG